MSRKNPDTRSRILRAARKVLESGQGAARMSDIAREAGISRQAVYLHFPSRAELLIATTRYLDEVTEVEARLVPSRTAATGEARMEAFIEAWGGHIPEIWGVARALLAMKDTDAEAGEAWEDRMAAVRHGCAAVVAALKRDGKLKPDLTETVATDLLWTVLSVRTWEHLREDCGWSQEAYIAAMKSLARAALMVSEAEGVSRRNVGVSP